MIERQRLVQAAQRAMEDQSGVLEAKAAPVVDAVLDAMIDNLDNVGSGYANGQGTSFMLGRLRDLRDGMR